MDKRSLFECDMCVRFITPAARDAGREEMLQIHEEVGITKRRIIDIPWLFSSNADGFVFHGHTGARASRARRSTSASAGMGATAATSLKDRD